MLGRCYFSLIPAMMVVLASLTLTYSKNSLANHDEYPVLVFNSAAEDPLSNSLNTGFLDQLLKLALENLGYHLKREQLPAERALRDVNQGKLDGEFLRIDGLQYKYRNLVKVDEKIIDMDFVVFSTQPIDTTQGWMGLRPYNVSFLGGWKVIERNIPKEAHITKVNMPQQLFHMLYKNRTDVIIYERWSGLNLLTNDPRYHEIQMYMPPLASRPMYSYLNKKHANLAEKLALAIRQLKQNGTYKRLYNKTLYHLSE